MAKGGRQIYRGKPRKLYIGEWLARLGRRPVDLAKGVGVSEQYVSELGSGRKARASVDLLLAISEWMELSVNDLYRPPPPKSAVEAAERLKPGEIAALGRFLEEMKGQGRK